MHLHLFSLDSTYVKCLELGPHVSIKIQTGISAYNIQDDGTVPKSMAEWTEEGSKELNKDKKDMNILFNGLHKNMFDNVINCKYSKEV